MTSLLRNLLLLLGVAFLLANCAKWKVESYDLVPQVKTGSATAPATTSVQVDCIVTELGPNTLQEFGIVYSSTNQLPTINDTKAKANGTTGTAKVMLNGLLPNTTYYYRTYATNNKGLTGYGDVQSVKTATVIADVRTLDLAGAPGQTSFQAQVQVANASAITIKEYGLVYSPTSQTPTTTNDTKLVAAGTTGATVTLTVSSLQPNTTYYYRAYAITDGGVVSYGEAKQVKTGEPNPVAVTLDPVGTASTTAVSVSFQVTNASAITLKEYGVVYSPTSQTPTITDTKVVASGTGSTTVVTLGNLQPSTAYYYRAYATNSSDLTSYGSPKSFTTAALAVAQKPTVETVDAVAITSVKANLVMKINAAPTPLDKYGICFSKTNTDPNLDNGSTVMVNKDAAYAINTLYAFLTDLYNLPLDPNTTYSYRGYATTIAVNGKAETAYGDVKTFKTSAPTPTWTQLASFPGAARSDVGVFVIGTKAYLAGGNIQSGTTNEVWEFDASGNKWTKKNNLPRTGAYATGFSSNGTGYLVGLADNQTVFTEILIYNPTADSWTTKTDNNMKRFLTNSTIISNKAYIAVGRDQNTIIEYNTATSTSRAISATTLAGITLPVMFANGTRCYIGGGYINLNNQNLSTSSTYELDPANGDKISGKLNLPQPLMQGAVTANSRTFAIGINDSRLFEFANDQWSLFNLTSLPSVKGGRVFFSIGNTVYYGLGYTLNIGTIDRNTEMWSITF